mmetsp:Transcript_44457/g.148305  ORF Transcript_44457/g.148305 Transcript_44457/m.148305 type:complete len:303 (-) Transcript_44457:1425-2333(-)
MKQAYDLASEVQRRSGCPSPAAKPTAPRRGCLIARTPLLATNRCSLERLHRGVDSGQVRRPPCAHSALHTVDRRARQSAVAPILLQRRQRVRAVAARQQHRALCRQRREPLARGSVKGDGAGGGRTNKTLRPADGNHTGGDLSRISHVDDPNVFFVREEAEGLFTAGGVNSRTRESLDRPCRGARTLISGNLGRILGNLQRGENALAAATATATGAGDAVELACARHGQRWVRGEGRAGGAARGRRECGGGACGAQPLRRRRPARSVGEGARGGRGLLARPDRHAGARLATRGARRPGRARL